MFLGRALGVGEHESVGQFPVEESEVGEEEILVVIDEGLLEGAVETLGMGVHLGRLRVGSTPDPARPTGLAGMLGGDRSGEGQAARRIDEAHDVAAKTVTNALDGVHRPAFEGRGRPCSSHQGPRKTWSFSFCPSWGKECGGAGSRFRGTGRSGAGAGGRNSCPRGRPHSAAEFGFPAGEGPARDLEGIERGQKAVGVPEP